MIDPLPNCFSICVIASSIARLFSSRSPISFSLYKRAFPRVVGLYLKAERHFHQRGVDRALRAKFALDQRHRTGPKFAQHPVLLLHDQPGERPCCSALPNTGDRQVRREGSLLSRKATADESFLDGRLKTL